MLVPLALLSAARRGHAVVVEFAVPGANTLTIQDALAEPEWADVLGETDRHGLTAPFTSNQNRQAAAPNQIWQAGHTELDLWVITPSAKPARPWLTVIEDDHSRAVAGYAVSLEAPSAINTALALRHAI